MITYLKSSAYCLHALWNSFPVVFNKIHAFTYFPIRKKLRFRSNCLVCPTTRLSALLIYITDDSVNTSGITANSVRTSRRNGAPSAKQRKKTGPDLLEIRDGVCLPDPTNHGHLGINFYKRVGRWTAHIWYVRKWQSIITRFVLDWF